MFEESKNKLEALKIALDFNRRTDESLNNILLDFKTKYNIEDYDWLQINDAFELLTKHKALKTTTDFNHDSLNNILFDLKTKYNIEDHDWLQISVAFSLLTAKKALSKR